MKGRQPLAIRMVSIFVCLGVIAGLLCQMTAFNPFTLQAAAGESFTYTQSFDTQTAVTEDFLSYYSADTRTNYAMGTEDFTTYWRVSSGKLVRKDQAGEYFDKDRLVAMLTYDKKVFTDFELTVDYTFGGAPGRVMIGLGSTELGKYPSGEAGSVLIAVDSERRAAVYGAVTSGGSANSASAPIIQDNKKLGKLSVKVEGTALTVTINGSVLKTVTLSSEYKGGYLSLMASKTPNADFDNLTITGTAFEPGTLDGEPISEEMQQADYYNVFSKKEAVIKDFLPFYSDDASTNGQLNDSAFDTHWTIIEGKLKRKDQKGEKFDDKHYVASLCLGKKIFTDFKLSVDIQYGNTPGRVMVGFGGKALGTYAASDVGGVVLDIDAGGTVRLNGALRSGSASAAGTKSGNLVIQVEGTRLTVSMDGNMIHDVELTSDYTGGYISLMCSKVTNATFDNLIINGTGQDDSTLAYANDFEADDALGDFTYYYSDNLTASGNLATNGILTKKTEPAFWELWQGAARRKNQWSDDYNDTYDNNHLITALTYEKQTFQNFRLDMDFTWNDLAYCNGNLMVIFGQKTLGNYVTKEDGGIAAVINEQNGNQLIGSFYGNHKAGNGLITGVDGTRPAVSDSSGSLHHMVLNVYKDKANLYVDGVLLSSAEMATYYSGVISLAANKNILATVDNLQIRTLPDTLPNDGSRYENDFSNAASLSDFKCYYSDDLSSTEGVLAEEDFSVHWRHENGRVIRRDQTGENFDESHYCAMMTYTGQTYDSFLFECDFIFGNAPGRMMFGIGQTEPGHYATAEGGGLAIVLDVSGNATLKGKIDGLSYSGGAPTTMRRGGQTNHLKITYYDEFLTVEINDSEVFYMQVPGLDGYISLMATKVPNAVFDNLVITDYHKVQVDPDMQSTVVSIESVDDLVWNRSEDNTKTLDLPKSLKITTDKDEQLDCRIKWTSADYKASKPGTFHFIGTPMMPAGGLLVNPDGVKAETTVTVTVDYNTDTTVKYYIDSLDDFGSEWSSRYASDPRAEDLLETPVKALYYMDEGRLRRLDGDGVVGDHNEMTSLIYTARTFRNFQLDVDFRQGGNTWGQAMVGFGIEDLATYVTMQGGGALTYLTMEGNARFRGRMVEDTNSYSEVRSPSNNTEYADTWRTEMHHMTLRVTKLRAVMEIDGVEVIECKLKSGYTGGYVSLMSNKNTVMWDNFSVTALDYDGNVITFAEDDALPDTFSNEEKLIGEEEDDGIPVEIIGVAYKTRLAEKYTADAKPVAALPKTGDRFPLRVFIAVALLSGLLSLVGLKQVVRAKEDTKAK